MDKQVFKAAADVTKLQRRRRNLAEVLALAKVGSACPPLQLCAQRSRACTEGQGP
jgi:hypothetical protein